MRKKTTLIALLILLTLPLVALRTLPADEPLFIDFEDGMATGFEARGSDAEREAGTGILTVTDEAAHGGSYSLLTTDRKQNWNGPAINVAPYITAGESYDISVWVLPKSPDSSTFILSTQIGDGLSAQYVNLQSKNISTAQGWTEMTATYTYGEGDFITVYVENSDASAEFYIDDFSFAPATITEQDPSSEPITSNMRGEYEGFDFEFWSQTGSGGSMILYGGGTFTGIWDGENLLFRMGKRLGSEKTYDEYGEISLDYGAEHNILRGDVSYLCVYGWTEDPLVEFYIIENHGSYKPPGGKGFVGSYELDGSVYELYVDTRVEQPSIQGTQTFEQYFAVRSDLRTKGIISVSEHFTEWENLGLDMGGQLYEIALCAEGYRGAGNAIVYRNILSIGDDVYGEVVEPVAAEPVAVDELTVVDEPVVADEPAVVEPAAAESTPAEPTFEATEPVASMAVASVILYIAVGVMGLAVIVAAVWILRSRKQKK